MESALKLYLIGDFRAYAKRNGLDFFIVTVAAVSTMAMGVYNGNLSAARFPMSFVTLRVFTVFTVFKKLMATVVAVIAPFTDLLGLLLVFFFFYAILGNQIFIG